MGGETEGMVFNKGWDRWAPHYDRMLVHMEQRVLSPVRRKYASTAWGDVLEVGAGTGLTLPYYPAGTRLTLVDVSERMLAEAHKRIVLLGCEVELVQADLARLPFASETFDLVFSFDVLCSLQSPRTSLKEIARVLRSGGRAVFVEHGRTGSLPLNCLLTVMTGFSFPLFRASLIRDPVQLIRETPDLKVIETHPLPASFRVILTEKG